MATVSQNQQHIIVTGSMGYIGSQLVLELKKNGISHTQVDMREVKSNGHVNSNLSDHEATTVLINDTKPSCIVHCGTHSALAYRDNFFISCKQDFDALYALIVALRDRGTCRVIYFSSNYVYSGLSSDSTVAEDALLLPRHNFGVGKMFFEQYLLRNHPESIIFRLSSVFGEGPSVHPNAILSLAKEAIDTGIVTVWGRGSRMMQYVYLPDVIRAVVSAGQLPPGIYNLGGDEYISVADAAGFIAKFFGAKLVFLKEKPEGEMLAYMHTGKLRSVHGEESFTPFMEALGEYLKKVRNRYAKVTSTAEKPKIA